MKSQTLSTQQMLNTFKKTLKNIRIKPVWLNSRVRETSSRCMRVFFRSLRLSSITKSSSNNKFQLVKYRNTVKQGRNNEQITKNQIIFLSYNRRKRLHMLSTGCHKIKPQKLSFETDTHPPQKNCFSFVFSAVETKQIPGWKHSS